MVLPVHLRLSAAVAIVDCRGRGQFIDSRLLKQAAPQSIWLFQESLLMPSRFLEGLGNQVNTFTALHSKGICQYLRALCSMSTFMNKGDELNQS